ncbi:MAG: NADH-quinone oxidoreductase subunit NuoG [Chloroflexi bacterium]|nr:NADH-quinone oxidoreductase subunit NuoG [Chloroflexota bacterium]
MADLVNVTIDGVAVAVPKGTLVVDAAKKLGNDIPVFCYHPKLKPVGMCRMCLVDVGTPKVDPATKQVVKDDAGNVVIAWMPKLTTGCTTPVSEGMAVRTATQQVKDAREDVLEFLLTSHPLDCPVCDKGGECPLQNLTLAHGPGQSRFDYEAKQHNDKHVPLGDLIFLDRERCIQCARCIRFQDDIADDHVLQFFERGRHMEIMTLSEPGFDSYFSGNTTDICPVGALTSADFRFKARPWELDAAQSVCNHCPVGCNTTLNTRLETKTGGREIKRVMPRQNEQVNEIWLCDKGRFVHHYTRADDKLTQPMVRRDGKLVEATWDQAFGVIAERVRAAESVAGVIGDRIANEDAFAVARAVRSTGKGSVSMSPAISAAYADIVRACGVGAATDLKQIGKGDVILVVNADVEEQAPVWFLRLRQAAVDRGAKLVVAHHRSTKMHRYAAQIMRYEIGGIDAWVADSAKLLPDLTAARNVLIAFGDEKLDAPAARSLAQHLANLLIDSGHAGKANSGLLAMYPHGNTQGVFDVTAPMPAVAEAGVVWAVGVGDRADLPQASFLVVQDVVMTELASQADVVLPASSFAERDGSYTSGDRRVQRFYRALPAAGQARPDWWIAQEVARKLGAEWRYEGAGQIFADIVTQIPGYASLSYEALAKGEEQWPPMGRGDLYYGGTVYDNEGGLGVRYVAEAEVGTVVRYEVGAPIAALSGLERPERMLYQDGELIRRSHVMASHVVKPAVA